MPPRPARVVFLTGAPDTKTLEAQDEGLLDDFEPAFNAIIESIAPQLPVGDHASLPYAKWRSVTLDADQNANILQRGHARDGLETEKNDHAFLDTADVQDSEFFQHSFVASEAIAQFSEQQPSQDSPSLSTLHTPTEELPSFLTSLNASINQEHQNNSSVSDLLSRLPIADLSALPSPQRLVSLYPQTVIPNFLAGVISVAPPAPVTVRPRHAGQTERHMEIVEVVLGDDTAAGFTVTFWLTPRASGRARRVETQRHGVGGTEALRRRLLALRRGDVVLMAHVALNSYRGKVYGQSLRRRGTVVTGVHVVPEGMVATGLREAEKLRKVREWVLGFVGPPARPAKRKREPRLCAPKGTFSRLIQLDDDLPDDTQ